MPDLPASSRSHTSDVPTPSGVARPMPVTTTRLGGRTGGGWSNPRAVPRSSSSPHPRRGDDEDDDEDEDEDDAVDEASLRDACPASVHPRHREGARMNDE